MVSFTLTLPRSFPPFPTNQLQIYHLSLPLENKEANTHTQTNKKKKVLLVCGWLCVSMCISVWYSKMQSHRGVISLTHVND